MFSYNPVFIGLVSYTFRAIKSPSNPLVMPRHWPVVFVFFCLKCRPSRLILGERRDGLTNRSFVASYEIDILRWSLNIRPAVWDHSRLFADDELLHWWGRRCAGTGGPGRPHRETLETLETAVASCIGTYTGRTQSVFGEAGPDVELVKGCRRNRNAAPTVIIWQDPRVTRNRNCQRS
jgi:hypothetical protein